MAPPWSGDDDGLPVLTLTRAALRAAAQAPLPRDVFDFIDGGAGDEATALLNRERMRAVRFVGRVAIGRVATDTRWSRLGVAASAPVMIAPTAYHEPVCPDGEAATASAALPEHAFVELTFGNDLNRGDVADLAVASLIPLIVRGLLHPEDVAEAARAGAAVVIISNQSWRQLDANPATIDCIPAAKETADARGVAVLVDGGFISGADVLRGLALGADWVLIGRAVLWALAAGGRPLLERYLQEVVDDLTRSMTLWGVGSLSAIHQGLVHGNHTPSAGIPGKVQPNPGDREHEICRASAGRSDPVCDYIKDGAWK